MTKRTTEKATEEAELVGLTVVGPAVVGRQDGATVGVAQVHPAVL